MGYSAGELAARFRLPGDFSVLIQADPPGLFEQGGLAVFVGALTASLNGGSITIMFEQD